MNLGVVDQLKLIICTCGLCAAVKGGKEGGGEGQVPETGIFSVTSSWASCHRDGATMRTIIRLGKGPSTRQGKKNLFAQIIAKDPS